MASNYAPRGTIINFLWSKNNLLTESLSFSGNFRSTGSNMTNTGMRIKLEPSYIEAQEPLLSVKVPFTKIGVADWTLSGDNRFWQS